LRRSSQQENAGESADTDRPQETITASTDRERFTTDRQENGAAKNALQRIDTGPTTSSAQQTRAFWQGPRTSCMSPHKHIQHHAAPASLTHRRARQLLRQHNPMTDAKQGSHKETEKSTPQTANRSGAQERTKKNEKEKNGGGMADHAREADGDRK
ncbi:Hypothetical predicted protein, partial [Pelobates cultripes]